MYGRMNFKNAIFAVGLFCLALSGCSTISQDGTQDKANGVYHKVKKGETLWRIAKIYDVDLDQLVQMNDITNSALIEKDQLIFVPGATQVKEVVGYQEDPNKDDFAWPVKGKVLHYYGQNKKTFLSQGIDIQVSQVDEPVLASRQGRVVFADYLMGYDHTVILDHEDGFLTVYTQNTQTLVQVGDLCSKGQPIAKVGEPGSTDFLHFEIRKNQQADNPMYYLPRS